MPKLQKFFNWNKLKNLKKISYSLFVTHGLVNTLFSGYIVLFFKNNNIMNNPYIVEIITFLIVFIIDLILAGIIYYIAENKLYNWINNFLSKRINNYKIELVKEGENNEK